MKKLILVLGCILFAMMLALLLVGLFVPAFGYAFEMMIPGDFYAGMAAAIALTLTVLCIKEKYVCDHPVIGIFFALLAPIAPLYSIFCCAVGSLIFGLVAGGITLGCSLYLTVRQGKRCIMKTLSLILFGLQALPYLFLSIMILLLGVLFDGISETTVENRIDSPSGTHYAEVISLDQGALGLDMKVLVYENKTIPLFPFRIYKKPQTLFPEAGEGNVVSELRWKDDTCIILNGNEYKIHLPD